MFRKTCRSLTGSYWIDTQCYTSPQGAVNAQGIYEMFGEYSLTNGAEVRCGLIDWINERKDEIHEYVKIVLGHKNLSFNDWLEYNAKDKNLADEIAIFCLAKCTVDMLLSIPCLTVGQPLCNTSRTMSKKSTNTVT